MANTECLRYFSPESLPGWPTCGQSQGYTNNVALPCNSICNMIELNPNGYTPTDTQIECKHPNNLRFFFRVVPFSNPKVVQPNSLICAYQFPLTPNDCNWVEFKKFCPK